MPVKQIICPPHFWIMKAVPNLVNYHKDFASYLSSESEEVKVFSFCTPKGDGNHGSLAFNERNCTKHRVYLGQVTDSLKGKSVKSIYTYTDYYLFLQDYYATMKKEKKQFSYQFLSDRCGFKSKTYLHKVINGQKVLSLDGALKLGTYMKLGKREMKYFQAIVHFTNAKTIDEKEFYFNQLQDYSKHEPISKIRQNQFHYFNNWYNSVIRELVAIVEWNNNYAELARFVQPAITPSEAKKSVELLLDLELITVTNEGKYKRTNNAISTGPDIVSLAVNNFQKENLSLASSAIDKYPRAERDISTLTFSISEDGRDQIFNELAQFRKKIIGVITRDTDVDRVYQLNFQAFPLSTPPKDKK